MSGTHVTTPWREARLNAVGYCISAAADVPALLPSAVSMSPDKRVHGWTTILNEGTYGPSAFGAFGHKIGARSALIPFLLHANSGCCRMRIMALADELIRNHCYNCQK
jgi:hypothetical protein